MSEFYGWSYKPHITSTHLASVSYNADSPGVLFQPRTPVLTAWTITGSPSTVPWRGSRRTPQRSTGSTSVTIISEALLLSSASVTDVLRCDRCVSFFSRRSKMWCRLTEVDGGHCSVHVSSLVSDDDYVEPLNDLQSFNISVCGSEDTSTCRLLMEEYAPQNHSRERVGPCSRCVGSCLPLPECAFINS